MNKGTKTEIIQALKEEISNVKTDIQASIDGKLNSSSKKSRAVRLIDLLNQGGYDAINVMIEALKTMPIDKQFYYLMTMLKYLVPELEAQALSQQSPSDSLANAEQASKLLKSLEAKKP